MTRKAFTIEEANAELPRLEEILKRIEAKKAAIRHHDQKLQVLDALGTPIDSRDPQDPPGTPSDPPGAPQGPHRDP